MNKVGGVRERFMGWVGYREEWRGKGWDLGEGLGWDCEIGKGFNGMFLT